jgi:negative regulator of sigma E activity
MMTNDSKLEDISALVDGEPAAAGDAIGELTRSAAALRAWGRYHLISDCIRGQLPRQMDPALGARIGSALRNEPTVLTPTALRHAWLRPAAGLAVAASVAAMAIFAVRTERNAPEAAAAPQVAAVQSVQPAGQGHLRLAAGNASGGPARAQTTPGRINARLNRYLVNYNEYRNNAAVQGMIPYVRIVAHDDEQ